jgi:hypothetical protein
MSWDRTVEKFQRLSEASLMKIELRQPRYLALVRLLIQEELSSELRPVMRAKRNAYVRHGTASRQAEEFQSLIRTVERFESFAGDAQT